VWSESISHPARCPIWTAKLQRDPRARELRYFGGGLEAQAHCVVGGAGVPLALCGMGYRSWPMGNSKGLSRGEQRCASWGLVGRHGGQASVSQEVLTPGARGSRVTGMDRGLTPQCLCPSSATILPCYLGQDTFFLLASVYSFVSFGDLKFYPCWLQRKKILLLCCFTHTGQGSSILR
jgi:hypothetical protein